MVAALALALAPVAVRIGRGATGAVRPASVRVGNSDAGESSGHVVMLQAGAGDCLAGVIAAIDLDHSTPGLQSAATVRGGSTAIGAVALAAAGGDFASQDRLSPSRCVAELHVTGPAGDVAPTNDRTRLVIDVFDANDP